MKEKKVGESEEIKEEREKLPEKAEQAVDWITEHLYFVEQICENSKMTEEEIERHKEEARAREDYLMLALTYAVQIYHKDDGAGREESDNQEDQSKG